MSLTRQRLRDDFPHFPLLDGPTPIQRLRRLEKTLGTSVRIYVKRDDLMGIGMGGNKLRKLEFLIGDALKNGCDTIITTGGLQSNHARLTAAAAAKADLACELMLSTLVPNETQAYQSNGNQLLNKLFGARVHTFSKDTGTLAMAHERARVLQHQGRKAYSVGLGGSSPCGSLGYVDCAGEILEQERSNDIRFDRVFTATGSSGTHAGLLAGFQAFSGTYRHVDGYCVFDSALATEARTSDLIDKVQSMLGFEEDVSRAEIHVDDSQLGDSYGIMSKQGRDAISILARTEGLLVDPVYTGEAFAGMLNAIRSGVVKGNENVLFLMTGGAPGLFAYRESFE